MTTTQKLTRTATRLGWTTDTNRDRFEVRDADGNLRASATIVNGRFVDGYTVDRMGHVMSHRTVSDLLRFAGAA